MDTNPADLKYFIEIAETGNISRAAERLGIRQPSLSMAVRRLESAMGAPLLIRKKTGVELTRAGRELVLRSRTLLQDWSNLKSDVLNRTDSLSGEFTIGCHPSVACYVLPTFLPDLLKKYPGITIKLDHALSRKITDSVIGSRLDFGIVVNPVSHPDLVIQEICTDVVTCWDIGGEFGETLIYDPELLQAQYVVGKLASRGIRFSRTIPSSSLEVIAELARAGVGTAILPTRVVRNGRKGLRLCGPNSPQYRDRICLIYRGDFERSAAAKIFVHAARKKIL